MPGKNKPVYTIENQTKVFVFSGKGLEKFNELHAAKLKAFVKDNPEPNWQEERDKIEKSYNEEKKRIQERLNNRTKEINDIADQAKSDILNTKIDRDSLEQIADKQAKHFFPLPAITLKFNANGEKSFVLGKTQAQTDEKIEELSNEAVSERTDQLNDLQTKEDIFKTERTISFRKIDKTAINFIRRDVRTKLGKTVARSPEFLDMQNAIIAFDDAFNENNMQLGEDYASSKARLDDMVTKLREIARSSEVYFKKNSGFKIFKASKQRVEMAKNAYAMAMSKIKAIEKVYEASVAQDEIINVERKERYAKELADRVKKAEDNRKKNADQKDVDRKNALDRLKNTIDRDLANLETNRENQLKGLDQKQVKYQKDKLNHGMSESSGSAIVINEKLGYDEMTAEQQFAVNSARFSKLIFEEKHNPFAAYRDEVRKELPKGEIAMDKNALKDALPLEELKNQLQLGKGKFPITYNTDALMTLSNLQLYDSMTSVEREKNDYQVDFEFVKDGVRLPASALKEKGAEALSAEGFSCIVTGIKAEPIRAESGSYSPNSVELDERSMIPAETAARISNLDVDYVKKMVFFGRDKTGADPGDDMSDAIADMKNMISDRSDKAMLENKPDGWKKFNIVSEKALKKNIASDNLDLRPSRPSKTLKQRPYYRSGMVEISETYFDKRLMRNLKLNVSSVKDHTYDFDEKFNEKLLSEKTLVLADKSHRTEDFDKLMNTPSEDPQLTEIAALFKEVSSMGVKDVLSRSKKYLTKDGVSAVKPAEGVDYISTEASASDYDAKASELHRQILKYCKDHDADLADPKSPASVLKTWKNKAYPQSQSVFNQKDPNCKVIDATADTEGPDPAKFDGDGDYLCGAQLTFKSEGYWGGKNDELDKQYGADQTEFYMKSFKDEPLFTREPSVSDIKQGHIGNCYFIAQITAAINTDPQSIKDMIHDNDDGTVTCKFFNAQNQPTFVKVNKTVPYVRSTAGSQLQELPSSGDQAPLWFHLLQKAYILSDMRPFSEVDGHEKAMRKISKNAGGEKTDPEDVVRKNVLKARFGHLGKEGEKIINNASDELYDRILNHTIKTMDGGYTRDVYRDFTGLKSRDKVIPSLNGEATINGLRNLKLDKNALCGDRLKDAFPSSVERNDFAALCQAVAEKLTLEKTRYSKDLKGRDFMEIERVNMDDLIDAMNQVADSPVDAKLKAMNPEKRRQLCNKFCDALIDYQMNEPNPEAVIVSRKLGKHSAVANATFNTIKGHINKGHGVSCGFNEKSDRINDVNKVKLLAQNEDVSNGGMVDAHAFTILDYKEIGDRKILYIRNPWGNSEKMARTATLSGPDGKEEINYTTLASVKDDNTRDSGVFEMEINEFMEFAQDLTFTTREHSLNHNDVVNNLSSQYLKVFKTQEPDKYESIVKAHGYEKVFETTKKSTIIQDYAKKVFVIDDITKDMEDGRDIDASKLQQVDDFKRELSSVFMPTSRVKSLEKNNNVKQNTEDKQRGGALV